MYIMAPEPIPTTYFINPSHQSVCLHVYPPLIASQRLCKEYIRNNRFVGGVVFYAVRVVSIESRLLVLPIISCYVWILLVKNITWFQLRTEVGL
jgi:hypothetical protein